MHESYSPAFATCRHPACQRHLAAPQAALVHPEINSNKLKYAQADTSELIVTRAYGVCTLVCTEALASSR